MRPNEPDFTLLTQLRPIEASLPTLFILELSGTTYTADRSNTKLLKKARFVEVVDGNRSSPNCVRFILDRMVFPKSKVKAR